MPFANVEKVTVSSGQPMILPDGTPQQGRLVFTAPTVARIPAEDLVIGGAVEVPLVDGMFSVTLVASDATGMQPSGWSYRITAKIDNGPDWVQDIPLPKASAEVVLADIIASAE